MCREQIVTLMVYSDDEPTDHYYTKITTELAKEFQEIN